MSACLVDINCASWRNVSILWGYQPQNGLHPEDCCLHILKTAAVMFSIHTVEQTLKMHQA